MTLSQAIARIEQIALQQPAIRSIVRNDVYRLNHAKSAQYGVFAWLQGAHTANPYEGTTTYSFTFFYVDRLTEGGSDNPDDSNEIEVQSVGVATLENILRSLTEEGDLFADDASVSIRTFNERFADQCAGAFAEVRLTAQNGTTCSYPTYTEYSFSHAYSLAFHTRR